MIFATVDHKNLSCEFLPVLHDEVEIAMWLLKQKLLMVNLIRAVVLCAHSDAFLLLYFTWKSSCYLNVLYLHPNVWDVVTSKICGYFSRFSAMEYRWLWTHNFGILGQSTFVSRCSTFSCVVRCTTHLTSRAGNFRDGHTVRFRYSVALNTLTATRSHLDCEILLEALHSNEELWKHGLVSMNLSGNKLGA